MTDDARDVAAITALVHEYAFRIDAGDLDGVAELFAHAELGSSVRPERMRGTQAARGNYRGVILYDDGTPRTMHCITNLTITVDDGASSASARSYFTVLQALDGPALQPIIAGQYRDRFEQVDGHWRFTERIIHPDLIGDLSRHMRPGWIPR
jgi:ketosteroid isomerase-like protein